MRHKKKLFILVLLSFCLPGVHAQIIEWQNTIGGNQGDLLRSIKRTTDGGFIIAGMSFSDISGDKNEISQGGYDYWIVKTDFAGNIQWQNTIGGSEADQLHSIDQTADGGYILGGYSESNISGDKSENTNGSWDYWIVKTDSNGAIQWQNTIGGTNQDYLLSVSQTIDGGYILGGNSQSGISGDKTESSNGGWDCWIVKTDSAGVIQWQNTLGGTITESLKTIIQTSDGGYILGAESNSNISGDKTENSQGGNDYWIVKIDSIGIIQWQNTIGGNASDYLSSIIQTSDGGYFFGGTSTSDLSGDKTENAQGAEDFWILKTDAVGNIQWQNTIGGNSMDRLQTVLQATDGGFILGGYTDSGISGDKTEGVMGPDDFWVIKTDESGNFIWQNTIGGDGADELYSMTLSADGSCLLGGQSFSNISGDKTENSNGTWDYWILKITDRYNSIKGVVYADLNFNSLQDTNDLVVSNRKMMETITGQFAYTDSQGSYSIFLLDTGNFQVSPYPAINYYNCIPLNHSAMFTSFYQVDSLNDFAIQPTGTWNDLCVTITPTSLFRSGMNATYIINYTNHGTTTLSPTVIFYPDVSLNYVSSVPAATTIAPDSIIFTFGPLLPFQSGQILVTVIVNSGLPAGTMINSGAAILPVTGDANPACNTSYIEVLTTGSYDPNDILVNRDSLYTSEIISPEPLEYIIRFQNTGNDTAFYVRIDNKISASLQPGTIEFVAASHPCSMEYQQYDSTLKFTFNNILLPDSNINEPASHGFVRYKIKPETTLSAGDSIRNSAGIYFDYNAPVWTNTAVTAIVLPTGIDAPIIHDEVQLTVYPNPVLNEMVMEIRNAYHKTLAIDLYNVYGQRVMELHSGVIGAAKSTKRFDLGSLPGGIYVVRAEDAESQSFQISRIVKL